MLPFSYCNHKNAYLKRDFILYIELLKNNITFGKEAGKWKLSFKNERDTI